MIQIDENSWLELTQTMTLTDWGLVWKQRALLLISSLVISLVTILLTRRATKPLRRLGQAAEIFGSNPEMAHPLEEVGSIEIKEVAQSFNRMRKRICDNLNERNSMLEAMGHDLRTPLARVQLRLDKIQPESLREKFAANIDEIQSIIEQGLELARSLHTSEKVVPLDIVAFVESIADDMDAQGEKISLGRVPEEEDTPLLVSARPTCLTRSIKNLIDNAISYAGDACISVYRESGNIVIDIDDNGPGIPGELMEKVFEPYYRLEGSRNRESGGTGLGLSIARNMVLLNSGSLALINRPEGGLRARIVMPLKM
jgi:signal transduction histidine kinase